MPEDLSVDGCSFSRCQFLPVPAPPGRFLISAGVLTLRPPSSRLCSPAARREASSGGVRPTLACCLNEPWAEICCSPGSFNEEFCSKSWIDPEWSEAFQALFQPFRYLRPKLVPGACTSFSSSSVISPACVSSVAWPSTLLAIVLNCPVFAYSFAAFFPRCVKGIVFLRR